MYVVNTDAGIIGANEYVYVAGAAASSPLPLATAVGPVLMLGVADGAMITEASSSRVLLDTIMFKSLLLFVEDPTTKEDGCPA
jgi:hypothetical protein